MSKAFDFVPYAITVMSMIISVLLGLVAWFAKRELTRNNKELDKIITSVAKLEDSVDRWINNCNKCPLDIKLWVQTNFVNCRSFERQDMLVQENINKFKQTLEQVDSNLAYLVQVNDEE